MAAKGKPRSRYTAVNVNHETRYRMREYIGKGQSYDRWLNNIMDQLYGPYRRKPPY